MTIDRINVNGQTYIKQDFLDLILFLQNEENTEISVTYRVGRSLDTKNKTRYIRNIHNGQWYMIMDKGRHCNQMIRVAKENRQYIIQYC